MDKIKSQLAGVAALLGVIAAIGGGFVKYGLIKNRYLLLKGSVPGPKKRMIMLRTGIRSAQREERVPSMSHISQRSQR